VGERKACDFVDWNITSLGLEIPERTIKGIACGAWRHRRLQSEAIEARIGEITARRDPSEQADGHYRDALALAEELGMRPLVAHCHLGLGKLYRRAGNRDEAREHPTTAISLYRDMDMRFWLEQADAGRET